MMPEMVKRQQQAQSARIVFLGACIATVHDSQLGAFLRRNKKLSRDFGRSTSLWAWLAIDPKGHDSLSLFLPPTSSVSSLATQI
jgi:nucleoside phosphorylase